MEFRNIDLRQDFPGLSETQTETSFTAYLRDNAEFLGENLRFPAVIVCPGGGLGASQRRRAEHRSGAGGGVRLLRRRPSACLFERLLAGGVLAK